MIEQTSLERPVPDRTASFNDFVRRSGIEGVLSALSREEGLPGPQHQLLPAFHGLQPALRQALSSYWALEKEQAQARAVEQTLEAMPSPVLLLRRDLTVEYANRPAWEMTAPARLRVCSGRLACAAQLPLQALQELIAAACDGAPRDAAIWMPEGTGFVTGTLRASGLRHETALRAHRPRADAMLIVHMDNPGRAREARLQAVASRCRLTATETQVLKRLSSGETVDGVALSQRVRVTTVRTHIRHILDKTLSRRLVDLLRTLGG